MFDVTDLKVCFVAGTLGQGGAERQLFYMIKSLVESGARPRVLSLTRGEFWEDPIRALGVPISWVGRRRSRLGRLLAVIAAAGSDRPDLVQSQHFFANLYAVGAARALGIGDVGAIRSNASWEIAALGAVLGRCSLRAPRVVAANSQAAIRNAIALGMPADRLRFIANVVDTDHFSQRPGSSNGRIRFLSVGRRDNRKRFDRLVSIVAAVQRRTKRPTSALLVTTGDEDEGVLEQQAIDLGLAPDVMEFRRAAADMAPIYQSADVFLLTSDSEGTPNVLLEAMASGMPVVATSVGGVPEIVRHGDTGYLADPQDEAAFVDSIVALVENDGSRIAMGRRARAYVEEHHSVRRMPALLRDFYASVN
jgi:glycosyltransferase involved in cell wall biosynthesis